MRITHTKKHVVRNVLFAIFGFFAILGGILLIWVSTLSLPDFSSFETRKVVESTKIYDRTGKIVLYDLNQDTHRTVVPYTSISQNVKNAVVAIEDSQFYQHHGVRLEAMARAFFVNLFHAGLVQGGSTITQQVIKNTVLTGDRTATRKIKEIVLSLKLEREYTKDEILGMYLNEIPYGGNIYGVQEASRSFFGKDASDLTLAESAYLAAIPKAPSYYSPYGSHKSELEARKNVVLARMLELKLIDTTAYNNALAEKITFKTQEIQGIKAPHFVFYIKDYLEQKYGADAVETGGLKVTTTLDYNLQQIAEKAVSEYTTGDKKQIPSENAGLVAIDPKTGQILAMVGSRNYFDKTIDGNFNVATAQRQPGSSFKPFMYATAFEKGFTPETMLFDVPTEFNANCDPYGNPYKGTPKSECYMPGDYDNQWHGPMSIRDALARSMNVPAVKMLYIVGIKNAIKTAQDMGITTLTNPDQYGLALVLGGGEVKLLDMVSAYSGFANEGVHHNEASILSVQDKSGNTLETWQDSASQVLPRNVTLQISDILSDNKARTPTFGAFSPLYFPDRQVAVKTGTTNNYKDSWTIGYTPSLTAGVWLGKNDNTSMPPSVIASPIWHAFMQEALKSYPVETFEKPDPDPNYSKLPPVLRGFFEGNKSFIIDTISGKLATALTPKDSQKEYVITDVHDILHWISKDNPLGGVPTNPESDPLYNNFETAVRNWWAVNSYKYPVVTESQIPTTYDNIHTNDKAPRVSIKNPMEGGEYLMTDNLLVAAQNDSTFPLKKFDLFLNGTFVGTMGGNNTTYTLSPQNINGASIGENTLMVVGTDYLGNTGSASVKFTYK